ncbi:MAG TPA: hypothetical protein V6C72_16265 [Chroococcales cyanobacterium]
MTNLKSKIVIVSFFLFLTLYGAFITGIVLREPDICFLLASGRWICEHGQLPHIDPFSYTTGYHDQAYVIEKWLTEVIFFSLWKFTSVNGLLVFDAIVLGLTFVVMPYRLCALHGVRGGKALAVAGTCMLASFSHLAVRPEIFSYLLIAIFLELLTRYSKRSNQAEREQAAAGRIDWRLIAIFAALSALWANLHTLFIVGFMILALYAGCEIAGKYILKNETHFNWTVTIALGASVLATLVNPYGTALWAYLPNVFGPFNDRNNEMQPIGMGAFTNPLNYGFDALVLAGTCMLARRGIAGFTRARDAADLFFKLLIPAGIIGGIKTIRTIPISDLFISCGLANLIGRESKEKQEGGEKPLPLDEVFEPLSPVWISSVLFLCGLGAFLMTYIVPPEIPQGSAAFAPPFKAIAYIDKHRPEGNLLNYAHFGNVMMWQLRDTPPVFIDSRYNLFGNNLLKDYFTMTNCSDNWRQLMQKYKIDWIFMPPSQKISETLARDPDWQVVYQDKESVIIERKRVRTTGTESHQ